MTQWLPTEITEQIEAFSTSTHPICVQTDAGRGMLKYIGNPKGPGVIASDWLGNVLAGMLGLPGLEQTIIEVTPRVAQRLSPTFQQVLPGPALLTKWIKMHPWDGTEQMLQSTTGLCELGALVVLDTLILNPDRHEDCTNPLPQEDVHQNMDNLGVRLPGADGVRDLVVFDHGESFRRGHALMVLNQAVIESPQIYGLFPAFRRFIRLDHVASACQRLMALDWNAVNNAIDSIPDLWCRGTFHKQEAKLLLKARATWLASTLPQRIRPYIIDAQQSLLDPDEN